MDGPCIHFGTHLVTKHWGLNALQSANHRDHSCTFGKSWGPNTLQSANHRDHPWTLLIFKRARKKYAAYLPRGST
ncbi:hypothetical protein Hanom_Chr07g00648291 [Helianthus anomalus]